MSSSTWRVLSGYAIYQRTPMRMTSLGKWAPLKLIAIVALPHAAPWVIEGEHTANGLKGKFATEPISFVTHVQGVCMSVPFFCAEGASSHEWLSPRASHSSR